MDKGWARPAITEPPLYRLRRSSLRQPPRELHRVVHRVDVAVLRAGDD
jgi:hypothetical protein